MKRRSVCERYAFLRVLVCIGVLAFAASCTSSRSRSERAPTEPTLVPSTTTRSRPVAALATFETHLTIGRPGKPPFQVFVVSPRGRGPYPLVLFSHGYGSIAEVYASPLKAIAAQGYVVAGPDFLSKDFTTHPADLSRTIDRLSKPGALAGRVDATRIAVAGHSLGGLDVLGLAFNTCCRDPRITAALTFEGPLLPFQRGRYVWSGAPVLIVLGNADPLIAKTTGRYIVRHFRRDAYLLTILGGDHGGGMNPGAIGYASVYATVRDFLAAYLYNDASALRDLRSHTERPQTTLTQRQPEP